MCYDILLPLVNDKNDDDDGADDVLGTNLIYEGARACVCETVTDLELLLSRSEPLLIPSSLSSS